MRKKFNLINAVISLYNPERIHQAQAAAAKARKALQQKPKPASKPVRIILLQKHIQLHTL